MNQMQKTNHQPELPPNFSSVIKSWRFSGIALMLCGFLMAAESVLANPSANALYTDSVASGVFRVFYTTSGPHAIPANDKNRNGVPDRVDDLLIQLTAADWFYQKQLNLVPPLKQPRYSNSDAIEVHIQKLESGNGLAFDEPTKPNWFEGQSSSARTLKVRIGSHVEPRSNITPAHELFHLYQYGYAPFKTKWYTEGMARWMEQAFSPTAKSDSKSAAVSCNELTGMSYNASGFFEQLARKQSGSIKSTKAQVQPSGFVYSDGSAAIQPKSASKLKPVKLWLEHASLLGFEESKRLGVPPGAWPETLQRSAEFDVKLCEAL